MCKIKLIITKVNKESLFIALIDLWVIDMVIIID